MTPAEEDALMDQLGVPLHSRGSHRKAIRAAVAQERERCAKVCERNRSSWPMNGPNTADTIAAAIRRGE